LLLVVIRAVPDEVGDLVEFDDREEPLVEPGFGGQVPFELLTAARVGHDPDHGREQAVEALFGAGVAVLLVLQALLDHAVRSLGGSVDFPEVEVGELPALADRRQVGLEGPGFASGAEVGAPALGSACNRSIVTPLRVESWRVMTSSAIASV
jgi:hypothetical protein